jgi:DNA-binding MarR family transcriptional regulator
MKRNLFELVVKIRVQCQKTEEKIRREFDLSAAEYNGLLAIGPREAVFGHVFSDKMGLSPSRGSRVIDRLVKRNYIVTRTVPDDRRSIQVSLTRQGIVLHKKIKQRMKHCEKRMLAHFSVRQQKELTRALGALAEVL